MLTKAQKLGKVTDFFLCKNTTWFVPQYFTSCIKWNNITKQKKYSRLFFFFCHKNKFRLSFFFEYFKHLFASNAWFWCTGNIYTWKRIEMFMELICRKGDLKKYPVSFNSSLSQRFQFSNENIVVVQSFIFN